MKRFFTAWALPLLGAALLSGLTADRATAASCGDGILDPGEQCDDGNTSNGDCCDAACMFEVGPGNSPCPHWRIVAPDAGSPYASTFGSSEAWLGDLDGDGKQELAVGATTNTDDSAVWILSLNESARSVDSFTTLSGPAVSGGATEVSGSFGASVASLGDLDGAGGACAHALAVGDPGDDPSGAEDLGAVWIVFLNSASGLCPSPQRISVTQVGIPAVGSGYEFAQSLAWLGDLGSSAPTARALAVGAMNDDDGDSNQGAIYILFLNSNGTLNSYQKISAAPPNSLPLSPNDRFGKSLAWLGNLGPNAPTSAALAVGAWNDSDAGSNHGAVWILFLDEQGTVSQHRKINELAGGFTGTLSDDDRFGGSLAALGDLDGDGVPDLGVGAEFDDDGDADAGAMWILSLHDLGGGLPIVKRHVKVSDQSSGFSGNLSSGDHFGSSVGGLSDLDGDGAPEVVVGTNVGETWVLFRSLCGNGTVDSGEECDTESRCDDGAGAICTGNPSACLGIGNETCAPRDGDCCSTSCTKQGSSAGIFAGMPDCCADALGALTGDCRLDDGCGQICFLAGQCAIVSGECRCVGVGP